MKKFPRKKLRRFGPWKLQGDLVVLLTTGGTLIWSIWRVYVNCAEAKNWKFHELFRGSRYLYCTFFAWNFKRLKSSWEPHALEGILKIVGGKIGSLKQLSWSAWTFICRQGLAKKNHLLLIGLIGSVSAIWMFSVGTSTFLHVYFLTKGGNSLILGRNCRRYKKVLACLNLLDTVFQHLFKTFQKQQDWPVGNFWSFSLKQTEIASSQLPRSKEIDHFFLSPSRSEVFTNLGERKSRYLKTLEEMVWIEILITNPKGNMEVPMNRWLNWDDCWWRSWYIRKVKLLSHIHVYHVSCSQVIAINTFGMEDYRIFIWIHYRILILLKNVEKLRVFVTGCCNCHFNQRIITVSTCSSHHSITKKQRCE